MGSFEVSGWVKSTLSGIPAGQSILDVGAGECQYKGNCQHLKYISQDLCEYNGKDEGKWDYSKIDLKCDITSIPVDGASFDNILCSDVLEHVPEPDKAIKEFTRILRSGGLLILSTPFSCNTHQLPYFFNAGLHENWYKFHLQDYDILEIHKDGNYFTQLSQELSRLKSVWLRTYSEYRLDCFEEAKIESVLILINKIEKLSGDTSNFVCGSYQILARRK